MKYPFIKKPVSICMFFVLWIGYSFAQVAPWQYMSGIEITENSGAAKTNYPVFLSINTQALVSSGKMDASGKDIRFVQDCNNLGSSLNFWIESGMNTANTSIWIQVPSLPASGKKQVYMFYGNTAATSESNFDSVFVSSKRKIVNSPEVIQAGVTSWNYDWIEIKDLDDVLPALTLAANHEGTFTMQARKIIFAGRVDGNGLGYDGGTSPGERGKGPEGGYGSTVPLGTAGGGGGYGAKGGKGGGNSFAQGGNAYGDTLDNTVQPGSGGGVSGTGMSTGGGNGGAAFIVRATVIDIASTGGISADGTEGGDYVYASGGGSGGGVLLEAKKIIISGMVSVKGGKGGDRPGSSTGFGAGGGAGGRIKIYHQNAYTPGGVLSASGGAAGAGNGPVAVAGGNGTITIKNNFISSEPSVTEISVAPSITISTSSTTTCAGKTVSFTSAIVRGGSSPQYKWKLNGSDAPGANSGAAYSINANSLNNGDKITCVLTPGSDACATPSTATSNEITMTKSTSVTPEILITGNSVTDTAKICPGEAVNFTSAIANGGPGPQYRWIKNGIDIPGAAGSQNTYSSASWADGDKINCRLTSNHDCASPATDISNEVVIRVNKITPVINIHATSPVSICPGGSVSFTSTQNNGGVSPQYKWKRNSGDAPGINNLSTYTINSPGNNDTIYCVLTSDDPCADPKNAVSEKIIIKVESKLPFLSITASDTDACPGTMIYFTADTLNGGTLPQYKWKRNGSDAPGANSDKDYSSDQLNNNDTVYCVFTSNDPCADPPIVTSNKQIIRISTKMPVMSIEASDTVICPSSMVVFTSDTAYGGTSALFEWKINGSPAPGANTSMDYSSDQFNNNDTVYCVFISNDPCADPDTITSNKVIIRVVSSIKPVVTVSASNTSVCQGDSVTFSVTDSSGGGASPINYKWQINGADIDPVQIGPVFKTDQFNDYDTVTCKMISSLSCADPDSVISNKIGLRKYIKAVPDFSYSPSMPIAGSAVTFTNLTSPAGTWIWEWDFGDNSPASIIEEPTHTYNLSGTYIVTLTVTNGSCAESISKSIIIDSPVGINVHNKAHVKISPNPASRHFTLETAAETGDFELQLSDVHGRIVFKRTDLLGTNHQITLPEIDRGLYIIKVISKKDIQTSNILIF